MKSVIELVKTTQGYSIVEDGHEISKVSGRVSRQKQFSAAPKKFSQQQFTIYPYVYCQEPEYNQKYIIIPAKSQWFNLNQIHEIEKKALPQWFKTKKVVFGAVKPDKFEKNQELYKKYRNYIIDLARNQYISPTRARKGLAGDVCAIIRIHSFLEKNGLINYVFPKKPNQEGKRNIETDNKTPKQENKVHGLVKRKDCIDKDKAIYEKHFDKDHLELIKKIARKYRSVCHLCEGICGVIWYEYEEQLCLKTFQEVTYEKKHKNGDISYENREQRKQQKQQTEIKTKVAIKRSQNPFKFTFRLCASCFTAGNLPVVLSIEDFTQRTILDHETYHYEEPKDKKKISEQNKTIELLEKNKFSLKITAQALKITEGELYSILLCIPIVKIQKLARIDQQTDDQEEQKPKENAQSNEKIQESSKNHVKQTPQQFLRKIKQQEGSPEQKSLVELFEKQLAEVSKQQRKLYEEVIQIWLLKISAKLTKLSDWQQSTKWYASRLINDQKNSLAETLKNKV